MKRAAPDSDNYEVEKAALTGTVRISGEDAILIEGREHFPKLDALYVPGVFSGEQLKKLREDLQSLHYTLAIVPPANPVGNFCFYASDRGEWLYAAYKDQENSFQPCAWPTWLRHASFKVNVWSLPSLNLLIDLLSKNQVTDAMHRTLAREREEDDLQKVPRYLYNSVFITWWESILHSGVSSVERRSLAEQSDRWCKENTPNTYVFAEDMTITLHPSRDLKRSEQNDALQALMIPVRAGSCLSLKGNDTHFNWDINYRILQSDGENGERPKYPFVLRFFDIDPMEAPLNRQGRLRFPVRTIDGLTAQMVMIPELVASGDDNDRREFWRRVRDARQRDTERVLGTKAKNMKAAKKK
jgi:hypothetical protein